MIRTIVALSILCPGIAAAADFKLELRDKKSGIGIPAAKIFAEDAETDTQFDDGPTDASGNFLTRKVPPKTRRVRLIIQADGYPEHAPEEWVANSPLRFKIGKPSKPGLIPTACPGIFECFGQLVQLACCEVWTPCGCEVRYFLVPLRCQVEPSQRESVQERSHEENRHSHLSFMPERTPESFVRMRSRIVYDEPIAVRLSGPPTEREPSVMIAGQK